METKAKVDAAEFLEFDAAELPEENWRMRYPELARFVSSPVSIASLVIILLIMGFVTIGPVFWDYDPTKPVMNSDDPYDFSAINKNAPPSAIHPAGTDFQGRDLLSRLMMGGQISLAVGFVSMFINLIIGVGIGTMAGWIGGKFDTFLMRIVDALYSIPLLLIVINLQVFLKPVLERGLANVETPFLLSPDLLSIYLALGVSNWLTMARLSRAEVINVKSKEFVDSMRALGGTPFRILVKHVLPNCMAPLLVAATLAIPEAIFVESFLSFIGIGVSNPVASWGSLADDATGDLGSLHLLIFPALAISITMLSFNLFGDGLRDAFDPKSKK